MVFNGQRRALSRRTGSSGGSNSSRTIVLWCIFSLLLLITIVALSFYYKFYKLKIPDVEKLAVNNEQNYLKKKCTHSDNIVNVSQSELDTAMKTNSNLVQMIAEQQQQQQQQQQLLPSSLSSAPPSVSYEKDIQSSDADSKKEYLHSTFLLVKDDERKNKIYDFRLLKKPVHSILTSRRKDNIQDRAVEREAFDDDNNISGLCNSNAVDTRRNSDDELSGSTVDLGYQSSTLLPSNITSEQNAVAATANSVAMRQPQSVSVEKPSSLKDYKNFNIQSGGNGDDENVMNTAAGRHFINDQTQTGFNKRFPTATATADITSPSTSMPYNVKEQSPPSRRRRLSSELSQFGELAERQKGQNSASTSTKDVINVNNGGSGIFTSLFSKKNKVLN
ncbi:hypothetical protein DOLIC_00121 [Dolichomitus sp. PSUC_FEM 10030005]|nr:hypothetical protein [Dolichomitus sp. PSUC_FEM 10030005]